MHFLKIQPCILSDYADKITSLSHYGGPDVKNIESKSFFRKLYINWARNSILEQVKIITATSHFLVYKTKKYK